MNLPFVEIDNNYETIGKMYCTMPASSICCSKFFFLSVLMALTCTNVWSALKMFRPNFLLSGGKTYLPEYGLGTYELRKMVPRFQRIQYLSLAVKSGTLHVSCFKIGFRRRNKQGFNM